MPQPPKKTTDRPAPRPARPLLEYPVRMLIGQVSEYLSCSPNHVRALIEEGLIEAVPLNPKADRLHWRVSRESVFEYERKNSSSTRSY